MPHVRQICADQHEVASMKRGDLIAHHSMATAFEDECELTFGMKMPCRVVAVPAHDFAMERFPLGAWRFFENGFHGLHSNMPNAG